MYVDNCTLKRRLIPIRQQQKTGRRSEKQHEGSWGAHLFLSLFQDRLQWWPLEEIENFAADGVWCSSTTGLFEAWMLKGVMDIWHLSGDAAHESGHMVEQQIPSMIRLRNGLIYGYGWIPINTIFRGMNIHLPAILMFTRGTRFWPIPIYLVWCLPKKISSRVAKKKPPSFNGSSQGRRMSAAPGSVWRSHKAIPNWSVFWWLSQWIGFLGKIEKPETRVIFPWFSHGA